MGRQILKLRLLKWNEKSKNARRIYKLVCETKRMYEKIVTKYII